MKKNIVITLAFLFTTVIANAQEYKISKSSGKLVINEVNRVTIEGHSGNEIIFSSMDSPRGKDKRAEGLRAISSMGLEDNTGIGLSVQDKGNTIEVFQLKKMEGPRVKIMIPKGVTVSYSHTSPYGSGITLRNVESEIEISTVHNGVQLENVTGPLHVKTVHGEIEANLGGNLKSPLNLTSVHGLVDLTIPASMKADVSLKTSYGEIFVDPAIKIDIQGNKEWTVYGSNKVNGKINGGGLELSLSSSHSNIYLRKK